MLSSVRNVVVLENSLSPLQIAQSRGVPFFYHDFARTDLTFQDAAGTVPAVSVSDPVALAISLDPTARQAVQSGSSSMRPTRQAGGFLRMDGSDDSLLTTLAPNSNVLTLMVRLKFGPTDATTRLPIAGFPSPPTRIYLSRIGTTGLLSAGVGTNSTAVINWAAGGDMAGKTGTVALVIDGSTVKLYWDGVEVYSGALAGNLGTDALRLGASNNAGTAGFFSNDDLRLSLGIRAAYSAAEVASTSAQWNAMP